MQIETTELNDSIEMGDAQINDNVGTQTKDEV